SYANRIIASGTSDAKQPSEIKWAPILSGGSAAKMFKVRYRSGPQSTAGAALGPGVSQQAFKHAAGIRVAGVIPAREAPISKIPIGGAGFGNQVPNFLVGRPVRIKRRQVHRPLKLRHCRYKPNFRRSIAGT